MTVTITYPFRDPVGVPHQVLRGSLRAAAARSAALITLLTDRIDAPVLRAGKGLKIVANVAVGVDNIDVAEATRLGILVTNTPGILTEATADLAWALILAAARRLIEGDRMVRGGKFRGWGFDLLRGLELRGRTLGIVGWGRIGRAVAGRAAGFGMRVMHHSRSSGVPLRRLLGESDVVSLHCPLTPETRHLIGRREIGWMKRGAILINTARGPVVDERAMIDALRRRHLAAAGLDVFEFEPVVPTALRRLSNVVLMPHAGSATDETRRKMLAMAVVNVQAALAGKRPPNLVNPDAWVGGRTRLRSE